MFSESLVPPLSDDAGNQSAFLGADSRTTASYLSMFLSAIHAFTMQIFDAAQRRP